MRVKPTLLILLFLCQSAQTAEQQAELNSKMHGVDRLMLQGTAKPGMFLGLSLYTSEGKPLHRLYSLSGGKFTRRVSVWNRFRGGSYQAALWNKKVYSYNCNAQSCLYCPKYGYHLEGLSANSSGLLQSENSSPY